MRWVVIIWLSLVAFAFFALRFEGLSPLGLAIVWGAFVIALGLGRLRMPRAVRVICIVVGPASATLLYAFFEPSPGEDLAQFFFLFILGQALIAWFLGFGASYVLQGTRFPKLSRFLR